MVHKHRGCVQESPELALLPQEVQVTQSMQTDAPDVLKLWRTIFYGALGSAVKVKDASRLNKLLRKAGPAAGCQMVSLEEVVGQRRTRPN